MIWNAHWTMSSLYSLKVFLPYKKWLGYFEAQSLFTNV